MQDNRATFLEFVKEAGKVTDAGRFWLRRAMRDTPTPPGPELKARQSLSYMAGLDLGNAIAFVVWSLEHAIIDEALVKALESALTLLTAWHEQVTKNGEPGQGGQHG